MATLLGDVNTLFWLYNHINLNTYQKNILKNLIKNNQNCIFSLNIGMLDERFAFLNSLLDELVIDIKIQDKLINMNNYDLNLLKIVFEELNKYNFNKNILLLKAIDVLIDSNSSRYHKFCFFKELLYQKFNAGYSLSNIEKRNLVYILCSDCKTVELINEVENLKYLPQLFIKKFLTILNVVDDVFSLKKYFFDYFYPISNISTRFLLNKYNIEAIPSKFLTDAAICHYNIIKFINECEDINYLKNFIERLIHNKDFFSKPLDMISLEEQLKLLYAKDLNDCSINFEGERYQTYEGLKIYRLEDDFKLKIRVLGGYNFEISQEDTNLYEYYNRAEYYPILSCLMISSDNIAIIDDTKIMVGYNEFNPSAFMAMGNSDIGSIVNAFKFGNENINTKYYFSNNLSNNMRNLHSELDYNFKNDNTSSVFKKNPDFIVFIEETLNDQINLTNIQNESFSKVIQAAKDFGNLPIVIINRELHAQKQLQKIEEDIKLYCQTMDYKYLNDAIVRFANNRNGLQESFVSDKSHNYIRNKYFSNDIFDYYMNIILKMVLSNDVSKLLETIDLEIIKNNYNDVPYQIPFE